MHTGADIASTQIDYITICTAPETAKAIGTIHLVHTPCQQLFLRGQSSLEMSPFYGSCFSLFLWFLFWLLLFSWGLSGAHPCEPAGRAFRAQRMASPTTASVPLHPASTLYFPPASGPPLATDNLPVAPTSVSGASQPGWIASPARRVWPAPSCWILCAYLLTCRRGRLVRSGSASRGDMPRAGVNRRLFL
jgi:hypothetical protein